MHGIARAPLAAALAAALVAGCATAGELPAPQQGFSADVSLWITPVGSELTDLATGRYYAAPGRQRRELHLAGRRTVWIEREDLGLRWRFEPGAVTAVQTPLGVPTRGDPPDPVRAWREDVRVERRGEETLGGVTAQRYDVASKHGRGSVWLTDAALPLRYEGTFREDGRELRVRLDFTSLRPGPQDPALFELPPGIEARPVPIGTHGPGSDRKALQEKLRRQRTGSPP